MNHFFEEPLVAERQRAFRDEADANRRLNARSTPSPRPRLRHRLRRLAGLLPAPTHAPSVVRPIQPTTPGH
jgi:hypothetical protein